MWKRVLNGDIGFVPLDWFERAADWVGESAWLSMARVCWSANHEA